MFGAGLLIAPRTTCGTILFDLFFNREPVLDCMILLDFLTRLATGELLLLDSARGTELTRRGIDTSLPLWSAGTLSVSDREGGGTQVVIELSHA